MTRLLPLVASGVLAAAASAQPATPRAQVEAFYAAHPECLEAQMRLHAPLATAPADTSLRAELLALVAADQADRAFTQTMGATAPPDSLVRRMAAGDTVRTARLRAVVSAGGWPTAAAVGTDGVQAAFLVLQHSPDAVLQALLLPDLEAAHARGEVSGDALGLLTDRVRLAAGLPQRYGSQAEFVDGAVVFRPTEPGDVDARRAGRCMVPQALYRMMLEEGYGIADHGLFPD